MKRLLKFSLAFLLLSVVTYASAYCWNVVTPYGAVYVRCGAGPGPGPYWHPPYYGPYYHGPWYYRPYYRPYGPYGPYYYGPWRGHCWRNVYNRVVCN